ncbi:MAG: class I SAM-dependent methyltransferase [Acidimicrobiales bacterium]
MTRLRTQTPEAQHPDTVDGWDPARYPAFTEVFAGYGDLQAAVVAATGDLPIERFLDLGCGTGETAGRLLRLHHTATAVLVDANRAMLRAARSSLPAPRVAAHRQLLEDPLPAGPFDLVVSVLAVHHLEPSEKAALFARIRDVLVPGGRFVLGDLVLEDDEAAATGPAAGPGGRLRRALDDRGLVGTARLLAGRVGWRPGPRTPTAGAHDSDKPDRLDDQLRWLREAGLRPEVRWSEGTLAVVAADRPGGRARS